MADDKYTPETTGHDRSLLKAHFSRCSVRERAGWNMGIELQEHASVGEQGAGTYRNCPMCGHLVNDRDEVHLEMRESKTRHDWCATCNRWFTETDSCEHLRSRTA